MNTSTLSLIVAGLAVFVGPIISWKIAKFQINSSSKLAQEQLLSTLGVSNKQIVAPMRQVWINDLRELLAELLSTSLHYYVSGYEGRSENEYQRMTFIESKIGLMLNIKEEDHKLLKKTISELVESTNYDSRIKGENPFPSSHKSVEELSRKILKEEWNRVKSPIQIKDA